MRKIQLALVATWLVSHPAIAATASFASSFDAEAVETYLPARRARLLVVAAGDDLRSAKDAATALRKSLHTIDGVDLVMDERALGKMGDLADDAIVAKAKSQPVDVIVIVRLFGDSAVTTLYLPDGTTTSAFNVRAGSRLSKRSSGATSDRAFAHVASIGGTSEDAAEQFEKRAVWFAEWSAVNQYGAQVASWSEAKKGKYGEPLEGAAFYDYIGRTDLATQYRAVEAENSRHNKIGGIVAGAGLAFMLIGPFVWPKSCVPASDGTEYCNRSGKSLAIPLIGGGSAMLVGTAYGLFKGSANAHPVTLPEARALADEFNKDIAAELGLAPRKSGDAERSSASFGMSPWVSENGGGVAVGGTF